MIKKYLKNNYKSKDYIWFMRQAGRYLPEYKKLRKKEKSFLSFCNNIKKATKVTLQPIQRFNLDSAIIFSDILIIPKMLGQKVTFLESKGPSLSKLTEKKINEISKLNLESLNKINTYKIIQKTRKVLDKEKGLIGFCGAPWTVACYMIDGNSRTNFNISKMWVKEKKDLLLQLIDIITDISIIHLRKQGISGCDALMTFDSWASLVPEKDFEDIIIKPTKKIRNSINKDYTFITYARGLSENILSYNDIIEPNVLAIDNSVDLSWIIKNISKNVVLQGNLDPKILKEGGKNLEKETTKILELTKGRKHIFNVGHGIIKNTPMKNIYSVIKTIRRR